MLFYVKIFKDCNVILKVIVTNYVPMLLRIVKSHKAINYLSALGIACYLFDLSWNTLR